MHNISVSSNSSTTTSIPTSMERFLLISISQIRPLNSLQAARESHSTSRIKTVFSRTKTNPMTKLSEPRKNSLLVMIPKTKTFRKILKNYHYQPMSVNSNDNSSSFPTITLESQPIFVKSSPMITTSSRTLMSNAHRSAIFHKTKKGKLILLHKALKKII